MAEESLSYYVRNVCKSLLEGTGPTLFGTVNVNNTNTVPAIAQTSSVVANGSATTPAADAAIATTAALGIGTWDIEVSGFITGTTVATLESENMKFKVGAAVAGTIINPVPGVAGASDAGSFRTRVQLVAPSAVSVAAGALATTGAIYKASIVATRAA